MGKSFAIKYWLTDDGLERIRLYSNDGLTQKEIARLMGCSLTTLKKYANENIELIKAINIGRDSLLTEIEISAYKQAKGYYKTLIEYETTETEIEGATAIATVRREYKKWFPPDFRATSFVMRNLKPDKWDKLKNEDIKQRKSIFDKADVIKVVIGDGGDNELAE